MRGDKGKVDLTENSPVHGPFSEDFRLVWVPGWHRLSEDQSKIFKVLWELVQLLA